MNVLVLGIGSMRLALTVIAGICWAFIAGATQFQDIKTLESVNRGPRVFDKAAGSRADPAVTIGPPYGAPTTYSDITWPNILFTSATKMPFGFFEGGVDLTAFEDNGQRSFFFVGSEQIDYGAFIAGTDAKAGGTFIATTAGDLPIVPDGVSTLVLIGLAFLAFAGRKRRI